MSRPGSAGAATGAAAGARARAQRRGGRRDRDAALNELRDALTELLGAERRLRGREGHGHDGLTFAQSRALVVALDRAEELPAGELARAADLNPATVTPMLDHLEERGIVARRRSTEDRRVCLVSLTDLGRELVAAKRARWVQMWREALVDVRSDGLHDAAHVLRSIGALLDSL